MEIKYRQFKTSDWKVVTELMQNLSKEDFTGSVISVENIQKTLDTLTKHPERGTILLLENKKEAIGYAILINFWSNEFGGNILNIDELYIKKEFRSQGIGTNFIKYLAENKFGNSVFLQLEITPGNKRAKKLYKSLGFKLHEYETLKLKLN